MTRKFDYDGQPHVGMNTKGLLKANADKTVAYAKASYHAVQNVCAVFDDDLVPVGHHARSVQEFPRHCLGKPI